MKKILLSATLVAIVLAGCSYVANTELSNARARWQSSRISHYSYKLRVGCFCAFTERMPLSIEVKDGKVVSMTYRDGTPVSAAEQQIFAQYHTIDALFDFTSQTIGKADEIKAVYDPTYGFPATVQIDFIKQAADDELGLSVTDFQPLP